jgi:hypothetical protein
VISTCAILDSYQIGDLRHEWEGKTCRIPDPKVFYVVSEHSKFCPAGRDSNSCPPDQEKDALTKELASRFNLKSRQAFLQGHHLRKMPMSCQIVAK